MQEITHKPAIHMYVCVNARDTQMASCAPTITLADVKKLKLWIRAQGLTGQVVCTATLCQGYCNNEGGVASIYPSGNYFKGIKNYEELQQILINAINKVE